MAESFWAEVLSSFVADTGAHALFGATGGGHDHGDKHHDAKGDGHGSAHPKRIGDVIAAWLSGEFARKREHRRAELMALIAGLEAGVRNVLNYHFDRARRVVAPFPRYTEDELVDALSTLLPARHGEGHGFEDNDDDLALLLKSKNLSTIEALIAELRSRRTERKADHHKHVHEQHEKNGKALEKAKKHLEYLGGLQAHEDFDRAIELLINDWLSQKIRKFDETLGRLTTTGSLLDKLENSILASLPFPAAYRAVQQEKRRTS